MKRQVFLSQSGGTNAWVLLSNTLESNFRASSSAVSYTTDSSVRMNRLLAVARSSPAMC